MQYSAIGVNSRTKPLMRILRGNKLNSPDKLTLALPPHEVNSVPVDFKSGQTIVVDGTSGGFRPFVDGDVAAGLKVYLAVHDSAAAQNQAAGQVLGIDVTDSFRVRTGYFEAGTYSYGTEVAAADNGAIKVADVGDLVIGTVSRIGSGTSNSFDLTRHDNTATDLEVMEFDTISGRTYVKA